MIESAQQDFLLVGLEEDKRVEMAVFVSDGKKLLNVEYDDTPNINDIVDERRVISKDKSISSEEYAIFLLEPNGSVCCYVLDEIYILGKESGFESLPQALKAWREDEI